MDAIGRRLRESWGFPNAFSWLTVTVYRFQGIRADVRELAGVCSNNLTIMSMQLLELRHKSIRVHRFGIRNPGSCKEPGTRVLSQWVKVKARDEIRWEIDYYLVACVLVPSCWMAEWVHNVE